MQRGIPSVQVEKFIIEQGIVIDQLNNRSHILLSELMIPSDKSTAFQLFNFWGKGSIT